MDLSPSLQVLWGCFLFPREALVRNGPSQYLIPIDFLCVSMFSLVLPQPAYCVLICIISRTIRVV